jgi:hypothetical protein
LNYEKIGTIRERFLSLPGYVPSALQTSVEILRRNQAGMLGEGLTNRLTELIDRGEQGNVSTLPTVT